MGGGVFGSEARAADEVAYSINGGTEVPFNAGANVTIDVGAMSGNTTVRIFDRALDGDAPNHGVGVITISGTFVSGQLRIIVSDTDNWLDGSGFAVARPGITSLGGIVVSDASLRKRTRLRGFVTGDITGDITVGEVQRLQCGAFSDASANGTISGNITAIATRSEFGFFQGPFFITFDSIGYISASNGITGNITATGDSAAFVMGDPTLNTYGTIGRIRVGPSSSALGIRGAITAPLGRISSIWTTGPIGTSTAAATIEAGDGVLAVRTVSFDGDGQLLGVASGTTMNVNVDAGKGTTSPQASSGAGAYPFNGVRAIVVIESGGAIKGSIRAGVMSFGDELWSPTSGSSTNPQLRGILALGPLDAGVTIEHTLAYSNIVASSIRKPIEIGRQFKGAIIAYGRNTTADPQAGTIHSVKIGYAEPDPEPYPTVAGGFVGVATAPIDYSARRDSSDGPIDANNTHADPFLANFGNTDAGALDSLIRAETSIGEIEIVTMGQVYSTVGGGNLTKTHRPRIEAPTIGSLTIGTMAAGVVWSGLLEYDEFRQVKTDATSRANDYASIGEVTIGCVSPNADVWVKECPQVNITTVLMGEIHTPKVASGQAIVVGTRLADNEGGSCGCIPDVPTTSACGWLPVAFGEASPRGVGSFEGEATDGIATHGLIRTAGVRQLIGQVVLNNKPDPPETSSVPQLWAGVVSMLLKDSTNPSLRKHARLSSDLSLTGSPTVAGSVAPDYYWNSMELGGGAAGLVPYRYYENDSQPNVAPGTTGKVQLTNFRTGAPVRIRFYGPLKLNSSVTPGQAITITRNGTDVTSQFAVSLESINGFTRGLVLGPTSGSVPGSGVYIVTPIRTGTNALLCNRLTDQGSDTPVADFTYRFELIDGGSFLPECDFNGDTNLDPDDLADFIACYFGGDYSYAPCDGTDFNGDSTVDPDDLSDYISAYFLTCWQ